MPRWIGITFLLILSSLLWAREAVLTDVITQENFTPLELQMVSKQSNLLTPLVQEGSIYLFYKAKSPVRYVSVAFDFDGYRKQYVMFRSQENSNVFYVKVTPPLGLKEVHYRYIVDGLWTSDANNPSFKENLLGDRFSTIRLSDWDSTLDLKNPSLSGNGRIILHFLHEAGRIVSVAGNFNNWNPFIHRMKEDPHRPGVYSIELNMPKGEVYYYFVVAGNRYLDPLNSNHQKASFLRPLEGEEGHNVSYFDTREI